MAKSKRFLPIVVVILLSVFATFSTVFAQTPAATPPVDDAVKIPTEEVHLTISVEGSIRGFTPQLRADDFTIFEDGVPQAVTSMRVLPANALLLIDTGAALTFAKDREMLDIAAQFFIGSLPINSSFSIMQYNERVETLVPWSSDR